MAPLAVDPAAYFAAGSAVVAAGDGLNAAMTVLTTGFGANTGLDLAGEMFGLSYQSSAESVVTLAAAVINACRHNGAVVQLCASNYSHAEAASVLGGGASVLQPPAEPVKVEAPGPPGTLGPGEPPPLLWAVVQSFVDSVWPDGDVAGLHAAAGCWRTFGAAAGGMQGALNASKTLIGAQQMPEGDPIVQALSQMAVTTGKLGEQCGSMATTVDEFANQVDQAQNAIRDLLHQLESLGDLWNDVVSVLDGDALDEIKRIGNDINAVLHNLGREAREFEHGITLLMQVADGLVVNMEKSTRGQFTHFLGDAVGNQVANVSEKFINGNEGFVKEAIKAVQGPMDLNPGWFVVDPNGAAATWKSTVEDQFKPSLLNEILNPQEGGQANLQMWKSSLHLDDWGGDRPGMGLGELGFDVGASFIPGVGEAEAGAAGARAAEGVSGAADGIGAMGRVGGLGDVAATSGALGAIDKTSAGLTKGLDGLKLDVPKTDPLPGVGPVSSPAPKPFEAPVGPAPRPVESAPPGTPSPHSPTAPGGPPEPRRPEPPVLPHEPAPISAGGPQEPGSVPAAPAESRPALSAAQLPQEAPALASAAPPASAPHFPSGAPSAELPAPGGGGWHAPGDGGPPSGGPPRQPPEGGGSPGALGDQSGPHSRDGGAPGQESTPPGDHSNLDETPDGVGDSSGPPTQPKVPGVDYSFSADDALHVLEHPENELARLADGGVPSKVLDGYDPLAGRSLEEFRQEFTIRGPNGETWWDWDGQAPKNGFAGEPLRTDHIPSHMQFDRLGSNGGGYLSPEGTPLTDRATPPGLAAQYRVFEGTGVPVPPDKDWVVMHGPAKDAFGQPGGGEQWVVVDMESGEPIVVPVEELKREGMLFEPGVDPPPDDSGLIAIDPPK